MTRTYEVDIRYDAPAHVYATSDLYWAAALVALGFPVLSIESVRGTTYWSFERTDAMNAARIGWANKTLTVSAREYADALTMLKSSVHHASAFAGDRRRP